jgi:hypothetical protein
MEHFPLPLHCFAAIPHSHLTNFFIGFAALRRIIPRLHPIIDFRHPDPCLDHQRYILPIYFLILILRHRHKLQF